jgi:glycosyltransferase involved in cell wall biosynthesis
VVDDVPGAEGIVPGKVFEYIGSRRPVLAVGPEGAVAELVRTTGAGWVLPRNDVSGIADAVASLYEEWSRAGTTHFPGRKEEVERLSRRERTRELSQVLDQVLEDRNGT